MKITKHKYLLGVVIFLALALWSLYEAHSNNKTELVTMLVAVIGYFAFMVVDRIEMAASIEKLESVIASLVGPLHQLQAQQLLEGAGRDAGTVTRMNSTDSLSYTATKMHSARRMYNTSFLNFRSTQSLHYDTWLNAIIEGVTENNCIVYEVMTSAERLAALRQIFASRGLPLKGSYTAINLSGQTDLFKSAPFVEFCIFENQDDSFEAIFGWNTSNTSFLGSDCFVIKDRHMIEYFVAQFQRFEHFGKVAYLDK